MRIVIIITGGGDSGRRTGKPLINYEFIITTAEKFASKHHLN